MNARLGPARTTLVFLPLSAAGGAGSAPARPVITIYAQLLTKSFTGAVNACTPPLSWAIRFS